MDLYRMKPYSENKPEHSDYYMTYYYNVSHDRNFYKALWYDHDNGVWIWPNHETESFNVLYFLPESRNEYYTSCESWCNDRKITYKQE